MVVLVAVSVSALSFVLPISIAIAVVLAIVVLSYTQTVRAYETSGGAYIVAKDNLGTLPSLVAAAALLVDYVLTVAVSVTAGVLALTSAAPSLTQHKVGLSLAFVVLLTIVNLRGVRESGFLFALPTYGFVAAMFLMVGTGVGKCLDGTCPQASVPSPLAAGAGAVGILVLLQAFASGSAALTGVEAVSNGVGAFRLPRGRNAALTLLMMGVIAITLFLGVSYLAVSMNAAPSSSVSVISEIARATFPASSSASFFYYAIQALTFGILILAANTSYQGFPRLAAVLAKDRFFPRQFVNLGDRLVYSNGIIVLAGIAALLIWAFGANVIALIHLYVIGVFTAFTISQVGMVRYWLRREQPGWRWRAVVNGAGAVATALVAIVVIESKFTQGAWAVIVAIPLLIVCFYGIEHHYSKVARRLRAGVAAVTAAPPATNRVVLYVESFDAALEEALWYARRIAPDGFSAIHVPGSDSDPGILPRFRQLTALDPDLEIVAREDGRLEAVIEYLWALPRGESTFVTLVVPELFRTRSLANGAPPPRILAQAPPPARARCRDHRRPGTGRRRSASRLRAAPSAASSSRGRTLPPCAPPTTPPPSGSRTRAGSSSPSTPKRPLTSASHGTSASCPFRSRSRRRPSATSATRCSPTSAGLRRTPDAVAVSSCRSSSSAGSRGRSTTNGRSTSSACSCSSRA